MELTECAPLFEGAEPEPVLECDREPEALIVRISNQLIVFRELGEYGTRGPQCVARTVRGRCPRTVQDHYDGWSEWHVGDEGGSVSALEGGSTTDDGFIRQRCPRHLQSQVPDVIAPTWERFEPVKHADLIRFRPQAAWTPEGLTTIRRGPGKSRHVKPIQESRDDVEELNALLRQAEENRVEPPALTALYRYYDAQGQLLYVGITDNLFARTASHVESSTWMDFAVRSTIERHPTRKVAENVEREAIKAEKPLFNSQHNDTPEARKRLVEYLIEHGRTDLLVAAVSRG